VAKIPHALRSPTQSVGQTENIDHKIISRPLSATIDWRYDGPNLVGVSGDGD
jgi:hypothetical protein